MVYILQRQQQYEQPFEILYVTVPSASDCLRLCFRELHRCPAFVPPEFVALVSASTPQASFESDLSPHIPYEQFALY
jgi:hypothetical protein